MRPRLRGDHGTHRASGQSTVEFALIFPMIVVVAVSIISVLSVCTTVLALDDTARIIARAASTTDDPGETATRLGTTLGVNASAQVDASTDIITVSVSRVVRIWLVGTRLVPFTVHTTATILKEPRIVLGD